jgi:hypothetical protein
METRLSFVVAWRGGADSIGSHSLLIFYCACLLCTLPCCYLLELLIYTTKDPDSPLDFTVTDSGITAISSTTHLHLITLVPLADSLTHPSS